MRDCNQIDAAELMAQAQSATGLTDFGPDHFVEPLRHLIGSMNGEASLNAAGAEMQAGRIRNALENRLRRQALMKAHPEIADQKVQVAAVVVGMPRTGSTMLQRLLAASAKVTAPIWWETIFPLPRSAPDAAELAARKADAEALVEQLVAASAGFEAIHPMNAHAHDEELPLIEQSFMSSIPEAMMHVPSYGDWLLQADQSKAYDELIDWLKILQWQSPERLGRKWILKAPHHLAAVQTVLKAFPESVIVMTHRRVDHVVASFASMVCSLTGGNTDADFRIAQGRHWAERLRRNLHDMMEARSHAEHRFVDVQYRELLADPIGHARRIFSAAGILVDEADIAAWEGWLAGNKRDNRPSHKYNLADFGIDADELRRNYAFYTEAYGLEG